MKSFFVVFFEAIVVGVLLLAILSLANLGLKDKIPDWLVVILSGVFFHMAFEYTGLNKMYVDSYYS